MQSRPPEKNICIVGPAYPFRGGIAHYTACLAEALMSRGNHVNVFNFRMLYPKLLFPGKTMTDNSKSPLKVRSVQVLHPLLPWTWFGTLSAMKRLKPAVIVFQWYHVFFAPCLLTLLWLCRSCRIRTVVLCHNVVDHDKHALLNRWANRLLAASGARVIVHSARDAAAFAREYNYPHVLQSAHPPYDAFTGLPQVSRDEARRALGIDEERMCLFFGLVRKYKGLDDLVRALALIPEERRPTLVVAGEFYEPVKKYESLAAKLGLTKFVRFENRYVPNEEVSRYFTAADVLITPYRSASHSGVIAIAQGAACPPSLLMRAGYRKWSGTTRPAW